MIVRRLSELDSESGVVSAPDGNWVSRRFLLAKDGMGFSMSDTIIRAGTITPIWYKNHFEAVYCVSGNGAIKDLESGDLHDIAPGTLYALNKHDRHTLYGGNEDMHLVCVFNPPLTGDEVHRADGSYPPAE